MKVWTVKEKLRSTRKKLRSEVKKLRSKVKKLRFRNFPYLTKFKKVHKKEACICCCWVDWTWNFTKAEAILCYY